MTTEREREMARVRRQRLKVRDAQHAQLPRIRKLLQQGMTHAEIAKAVRLDRSRVSAIVRAASQAA